jgi:hypothetical protein
MLRSFNPKFMLFWRVWNIAFRRALSTEQYQSALKIWLLCWPLNHMPCLPELYYSAQCRDALQEMALSNRVRLVWVPGHCGIHGNPWPVTGRTSLPKITTFKNHKNCMICSFSNTFTVYLLNLRINYSF